MHRFVERSWPVVVACALLTVAACGGEEPVEDAVVEDVVVEDVVVEETEEPDPAEGVSDADAERVRALAEAREAATDEARGILKEMSDFLGAQDNLSFAADIAYDSVQRAGNKLEFGGTRKVTLRRPDRLRVEMESREGEESTLTFDGRNLAIDLPDHEAYVLVEKPGSVDEALDYLVLELGVPAPLSELVNADLYGEVADRFDAGIYVDDAQLDGRWCKHVAFNGETADVQLWIEDGDRPVLCRLVITYKHEPGSPQFHASFDGWQIGADAPDGLFVFSPPEGAERISVRAAVAEVRENREEE